MEWMILPLKRYADFQGRSQRMEYWMYALMLFLIYAAFAILAVAMTGGAVFGAATGSADGAFLGGGLFALFGLFGILMLGLLIPSIAVAVRRLHDTGRSGWWILLPAGVNFAGAIFGGIARSGAVSLIFGLAAFAAAIALIVFYCLDGTPGPNRFGPDPKDRAGEDLQEVFS